MSIIKLYGHPLSGHTHRVALFLSLLGLEFKEITIDILNGQHKSKPFISMNPMGQIPVLLDGNQLLCDSNAILVYLATEYGYDTHWLPKDPLALAKVQRFLSLSAGPLLEGPARARLIKLFDAPFNQEKAIGKAHAYLSLINNELNGNQWLAGEQPTLADISQYSFIARAPEGYVSLNMYSNIKLWLTRIEGLQGFKPMMITPVTQTA